MLFSVNLAVNKVCIDVHLGFQVVRNGSIRNFSKVSSGQFFSIYYGNNGFVGVTVRSQYMNH